MKFWENKWKHQVELGNFMKFSEKQVETSSWIGKFHEVF